MTVLPHALHGRYVNVHLLDAHPSQVAVVDDVTMDPPVDVDPVAAATGPAVVNVLVVVNMVADVRVDLHAALMAHMRVKPPLAALGRVRVEGGHAALDAAHRSGAWRLLRAA